MGVGSVWLMIGGVRVPSPPWPFSFGYVGFVGWNALTSGVAGFALALASARSNETFQKLALSLSAVGLLLTYSQFFTQVLVDELLRLFR